MTPEQSTSSDSSPVQPRRAAVRKVAHLLCDTPSNSVDTPRKRIRRSARPPSPPPPPPLPPPPARGTPARRIKFYQNAAPSSHCHVCARTAAAVRFAVCARLAVGLCRKVACDKCFARFGWDWAAAVGDPSWTCPHCRGACPPGRSQCFIYARVNRRRETKRAARAAAAAAVAAVAASAPISTGTLLLPPLPGLPLPQRLPPPTLPSPLAFPPPSRDHPRGIERTELPTVFSSSLVPDSLATDVDTPVKSWCPRLDSMLVHSTGESSYHHFASPSKIEQTPAVYSTSQTELERSHPTCVLPTILFGSSSRTAPFPTLHDPSDRTSGLFQTRHHQYVNPTGIFTVPLIEELPSTSYSQPFMDTRTGDLSRSRSLPSTLAPSRALQALQVMPLPRMLHNALRSVGSPAPTETDARYRAPAVSSLSPSR